MDKILGVCGLDCGKCEAYLATAKNDQKAREEIAKKWEKEYGHPMKPEEVNCVGCNFEGAHIGYCAVCAVRACGQGKSVTCCAKCADFSDCQKIADFHQKAPEAKKNCQKYGKRSFA